MKTVFLHALIVVFFTASCIGMTEVRSMADENPDPQISVQTHGFVYGTYYRPESFADYGGAYFVIRPEDQYPPEAFKASIDFEVHGKPAVFAFPLLPGEYSFHKLVIGDASVYVGFNMAGSINVEPGKFYYLGRIDPQGESLVRLNHNNYMKQDSEMLESAFPDLKPVEGTDSMHVFLNR